MTNFQHVDKLGLHSHSADKLCRQTLQTKCAKCAGAPLGSVGKVCLQSLSKKNQFQHEVACKLDKVCLYIWGRGLVLAKFVCKSLSALADKLQLSAKPVCKTAHLRLHNRTVFECLGPSPALGLQDCRQTLLNCRQTCRKIYRQTVPKMLQANFV